MLKIPFRHFKKWLVEEEREAKEVNTVFNEITIVIWNLLLLNGGAIFFMASFFWIVFDIPFETVEKEGMYLISLYTWWLSILAFVLYVLMFISHNMYLLIKSVLPTSNKNMFYENVYILSSVFTPSVFTFLIPHDDVITQVVFYLLIISFVFSIFLAYFRFIKMKDHHK